MYAFITLIREAQYARFGSALRLQSSADDAGLFTCTCHFALARSGAIARRLNQGVLGVRSVGTVFAAAVVSSAADNGGTWAGAVEALKTGKIAVFT